MAGWLARLLRRMPDQRATVPETTGSSTQAPTERDADEQFRRGIELFNGSQLAQACRCFEAAIELSPEFPDAYCYLGLAHHRLGRFEDAVDAFTLASCLAPGMATAYLGLADAQWKQGKPRAALDSIERAIELDGRNPESYKLRAALLVETGDVPAAVASYQRAVELSPEDASAHASLGYLLFNDCAQYESGVQHLERALEIDPDNVFARCNYTLVLLSYRGDLEQTVQTCDRLLAEQPDLHEARLNRGLALLTLGRFDTAWDDYEARKQVRGNYVARATYLPEWQGSDLAGKTVLIHGEQGLGDEIMYASCFDEVVSRAAHCVIECSPRLRPLFARSFPAAEVTNDWRAEERGEAGARDGVDFRIAAGSLPRFFRRSWSDFPRHEGYLLPDPAAREAWGRKLAALGPGLTIGLSWQGGAVSTRRNLRTIPLMELAPLLGVDGYHFIDLQYGDTEAERTAVRRETGRELHHWPEAIDDLDHCAAVISNLDLVISVCTAVIHLTGALGRPAWIMVPRNPEWRYLGAGEHMPWYPSITLIRQRDTGNWHPVIAEIERRLRFGI